MEEDKVREKPANGLTPRKQKSNQPRDTIVRKELPTPGRPTGKEDSPQSNQEKQQAEGLGAELGAPSSSRPVVNIGESIAPELLDEKDHGLDLDEPLIDTVNVTFEPGDFLRYGVLSHRLPTESELFTNSLKAVPVPILLVNRSLLIQFANPIFHTLTGNHENVVGMRLSEVFPRAEESRMIRGLMEKAGRTGSPFSREGFLRIFGHLIWAQLSVSAVKMEKVCFYLIALQSLKAARQLLGMWKYKKLISIVPIGIAEFALATPVRHDRPEDEVLSAIYSARLVDGNNEFARMRGKTDIKQIVGTEARKLAASPGENLDSYSMWIRKFFPTGSFEIQEPGPDGKIQYIEQTLIGEVKNGRIISFWEIRQNTTTRRLSEQRLRNSLEKLKRTLRATVDAIGSVAEKRDPYTAGHQKQVADLALAIAQELGLSEDDCTGIHLAASIHDIGKIYVPAEFLSKPGTISEAEKVILRAHPSVGYDILKGIEFPWPIARIILQHHERIDGSGYPDGLSGDQILFEARIVGVADVVEAMSSHRPYRPSLGLKSALEEITKNRGILYDPDVVDACLAVAEHRLGVQ